MSTGSDCRASLLSIKPIESPIKMIYISYTEMEDTACDAESSHPFYFLPFDLITTSRPFIRRITMSKSFLCNILPLTALRLERYPVTFIMAMYSIHRSPDTPQAVNGQTRIDLHALNPSALPGMKEFGLSLLRQYVMASLNL